MPNQNEVFAKLPKEETFAFLTLYNIFLFPEGV
jgi:hypothetical protein